MLSGNDNLQAGGQFLVPASSVFANLSSVRRLSIYQGKLMRDLYTQGFVNIFEAYGSLLLFCDKLADGVINKFTDISDDGKSMWRSAAVRVVSTVTTLFIGLFVLGLCIYAIEKALLWISLAVFSLFVVHNIVHTALLGLNNICREAVDLWKALSSHPMQSLREGAGRIERVFETVLHRISLFALASIYITPSVLTSILAVALNPLYMLLNAVFPGLDLEEVRVTKQELLAIAQDTQELLDDVISAAADHITSNALVSAPQSSVEASTDAVREVVKSVETVCDALTARMSRVSREFNLRMVEQDLCNDVAVTEALASVSACRDATSTFKHAGSAVLSVLETADSTQAASAGRTTAIRILKHLKSSPEVVDTIAGRLFFTINAGSRLFNEQEEMEVSGFASLTDVSAEAVSVSMARAV